MRAAIKIGRWAALCTGILFPGTAAAQADTAIRPARASELPARQSWTSDRAVLKEGSLITILVDEYVLASATKAVLAAEQRDRELGLLGGTAVGPVGGSVRTRNAVGDRRRGEASREQTFSTEISARVVEIAPDGSFRVEGSKKFRIDEYEEELTLRGWVRPQDLSFDNTVPSSRLGDLEIAYSSNGQLGKVGGLWSRVLKWIWP